LEVFYTFYNYIYIEKRPIDCKIEPFADVSSPIIRTRKRIIQYITSDLMPYFINIIFFYTTTLLRVANYKLYFLAHFTIYALIYYGPIVNSSKRKCKIRKINSMTENCTSYLHNYIIYIYMYTGIRVHLFLFNLQLFFVETSEFQIVKCY